MAPGGGRGLPRGATPARLVLKSKAVSRSKSDSFGRVKGGRIMRRVVVTFADRRLEFEPGDDRLVLGWEGPVGLGTEAATARVAEALGRPRDFPPLRLAAVPGDRVAIALGDRVPEPSLVLAEVGRVLVDAGVEPADVTVLVGPGNESIALTGLPEGFALHRHDPAEPDGLAYLATTRNERRVYLNRRLTDADLVLPVGRFDVDPSGMSRGPLDAAFPALSDKPDQQIAAGEAAEVGWLLGCQYQLGVVSGITGIVDAIGGLGDAVTAAGTRAFAAAWGVTAPSRAELVVAGVGRPGVAGDVDDLGRALATATALVQRGGKIVVLSRVAGRPGPSLRRFIQAGDPRLGLKALKGREADADHASALRVAEALNWADVYLYSDLDPDDVEGLGVIALERPEEARRLLTLTGSCILLSHAESAHASVAEEDP